MAETHGSRASVGRVVFSGQSLVFGVYYDRNENYWIIFLLFFSFLNYWMTLSRGAVWSDLHFFFKDLSGCCVGKGLKRAREAAEKLVRKPQWTFRREILVAPPEGRSRGCRKWPDPGNRSSTDILLIAGEGGWEKERNEGWHTATCSLVHHLPLLPSLFLTCLLFSKLTFLAFVFWSFIYIWHFFSWNITPLVLWHHTLQIFLLFLSFFFPSLKC